MLSIEKRALSTKLIRMVPVPDAIQGLTALCALAHAAWSHNVRHP